ncbi:hypothetical protein RJ639_043280 [Escallonia herrerae]|uniref:Retrotransposon gag domain-containing protein n=1 Tax=Escallonia herrerae TaxID=1293975 RepID=A0AA89B8N2_9ASTE|nr:hypothetical protein RJ639_043280 [Escallonia herrerae]
MSQAFEKLTKTVEEKDFQIATLMNKLELQANEESNRGEVNEASKKGGANGRHDESTFDRSLKGNVFDWYTDIEPESIDCWEVMEHEFLNWFYSTRCSISMMELTNTRQWKEEPVVDYINRWHSLSLDCKERLSKILAVEMCMQGMHWGLLYILQVTTAPLKVPKKDMHKEEKTLEHLREKPRQQPSLKELEGKVYPFPDSDVPGILDFLLEKGIIELRESKRP